MNPAVTSSGFYQQEEGMSDIAAAELAAYLVLSNIIVLNGCDLWVSPHGGRDQVEEPYEEAGGPYVVLPIQGIDEHALRALTELQRDTRTPGAEGFYRRFLVTIQAAYSAGSADKAIPEFRHDWPANDDLNRAFTCCIRNAHDAGSRRLGPVFEP